MIAIVDRAIENAVVKRPAAAARMPARFVKDDRPSRPRKANGRGEPGHAGTDDVHAAHGNRLWRSAIQIFSAREIRTG